MVTQNLLNIFCIWLVFMAICIIESATDENLSSQRYLPITANNEQLLNNNKGFQQIMQGGGSPADVGWPQPPKLKTDKIDVKTEIAKLNSSYIYQSSWAENLNLGAVSAVSFDRDGNVVIFHRVDRIWSEKTFNLGNVFMERKKGPIRENTVMALNPKTGEIVYEWGKGLFYMPHGLTVDPENNVWVTDVALHQVFKFGPRGSNDKSLLTLGTAFMPGAGESKFCKPTSVAVLENGDFFVADGYCNARILKYSKSGEKILAWGQNSFAGVSYDVAPKNFFAIPHALTLVPEKELICTADRENGRVQCFFWSNGTFHSQYHSPIIGDRLFSMDYTPAEGGQLVIVNGPTAGMGIDTEHYNEVRGYVMNMKTKQIVSKFGPNYLQFENPHDVAVTKDGNEIYVAELNPPRIHKFLHKSVAKSLPISAAKPATTQTKGIGPQYDLTSSVIGVNNTIDSVATAAAASNEVKSNSSSHSHPGGMAILVASLMLLFALLTFLLAFFIARRRKRGCLPFGEKNRRHAWDFPTKSEGFKLGGLLMDRSNRGGFEQLDQDASDDETAATTNMLSSAQFA